MAWGGISRAIRLAALVLGLVAAAPAARAEQIVAAVRLNGVDTGEVLNFEGPGDRLAAQPVVLEKLGLKRTVSGDPESGSIQLASLPGVRYRFDQETQSVDITAEPDRLIAHTLSQQNGGIPTPAPAGKGVVLNYGVYALAGGGRSAQASMVGEARAFGPAGVLSNSFTYRRAAGEPNEGFRRLDTTFVRDDYERSRRLAVGDFITAGMAWTRPVRAAGVSLSTDFTLRPDIITQPLPKVKGAAAVPSTVDLYVDGVRRFSSPTPAGPFAVEMAPAVSGRGQVTLAVTDAFGRQTAQTFQFYATSELLRAGASSMALEAGALREDYAWDTDRYTDGFVSVAARRGVTDSTTVELQAVASGDVQSAGVGVVAKLGEQALMAAAFNASNSSRGFGSQTYVSVKREGGPYSVFASLKRVSANFDELGVEHDVFRVRSEVLAGASMRAGRMGSFSATYSDLRSDRHKFRVASLSWSKAVRLASFYANAVADLDGRSGSAINVGFTAPLGGDGRTITSLASASKSRSNVGVQVSQNAPEPYGWGWRTSAETPVSGSGMTHLEAEARRTAEFGEVGVGVSQSGDSTAARVYASGAVVLMGGRPRFTAQAGDSFALVETGEPDIAITVENRVVGRTGDDGRLLIPRMSSGSANRIAIQAESVDLSQVIDVDAVAVRPPRGKGVLVSMPVRKSSAVMVRLVDPEGAPLRVGLPFWLNGQEGGVVGFDGLAFVTGLDSRNFLEINDQSGGCRLELPYVPTPGPLAQIGPLVCDLAGPRSLDDRTLRRADNGEGGGAGLRSPDGRRELRDVQPSRGARQSIGWLRRGQMHLHRLGLYCLQLFDRAPGRGFGAGKRQAFAQVRSE